MEQLFTAKVQQIGEFHSKVKASLFYRYHWFHFLEENLKHLWQNKKTFFKNFLLKQLWLFCQESLQVLIV